MEVFFWSIIFGIISGLVYEVIYIVRTVFNYNTIITIILDVLTFVVCGILFTICIYSFNFGILRLYEIIAFCLGFLICIFSIGKIVAIATNFAYNYIVTLYNKVKLKKVGNNDAKR